MHDHATSLPTTVLADGLSLGESPRWFDGRWWCADWAALEILAIDADGTREVVRSMSSFPFSLAGTPEGALSVVGDGMLRRLGPDGEWVTIAALGPVSEHPWNEIVVDGRGNTYLNNIGFDMMGGAAPGEGFVALVTPDGTVRRVAEGFHFPNGMAVTPDNSTLLVAESYANRLTAFDIAADGSLSDRRVWADLGEGCPDGICLDAEGAAWYADVPNRRCVRVREGGEVLHTVEVDRGCFACMLGGVDGRTLLVVAADWGGSSSIGGEERTGQVLTAVAPSPGVGWP